MEGTIRFEPDISYWTGVSYRTVASSDTHDTSKNAFFFDFQDSITFWLLGGENIVLSGGGTLDGAGQVRITISRFFYDDIRVTGMVRRLVS